ncbi:helix-turn-helix transcriptional regulator [Kineococcus rhizosphaerae]|uniref:helix-turn-helix transcriptional regulator n=1 Tax=Kineococcus rhizosphaerae TaxID=559628 RepID=UPI0011B1C654|nr:hypothetical protein [Kineococcus rhizosphaerae]
MPSRPPRTSPPGAGRNVPRSSSSSSTSDRSTQQEDDTNSSATLEPAGSAASNPDSISPDTLLTPTGRSTSSVDAAQEWWTTAEIAEHCGISRASVRAYVSRGILPAPATTIGRTPVWRPQAVIEAHAARRGRGWRRKA